MLIKLPVVLIILSLLVGSGFAQAPIEKKDPPKEEKESLEKMAVAFLRETMADVSSMRSSENRISFSAEMAGLMWFYDEREARGMYMTVIADFRALMDRYATELAASGPKSDDDAEAGSFLSVFGSPDPTDRTKLIRKLTSAMAVRQQMALSIAEHDPDLAYSFFLDTRAVAAAPEIKDLIGRDTFFEGQLITQIANKSPEKAAKLAAKSLADGVNNQHVELLRKLHAKDAEKGTEFGGSILSALSSTGEKTESYVINSLITLGEDVLEKSKRSEGKKAIYSQEDLRQMAEILAKRMLDAKIPDPDDEDEYGDGGDRGPSLSYLKTVEKYSPGRAAQIRAKYKITAKEKPSTGKTGPVNTGGTAVSSAANIAKTAEQRRQDEANSEKQLMEGIGKLGSKELPKEERDKFISDSRKIIMQNRSREKKILALSALAAQVSKLGDKDLATQIMKDAEGMVNPAPKNYHDFLLSWMLATGYASTDPDRSFALLDETIGRANETLAAFVKVGEFIDVAEQMISDGEVQVGAFGGQMVRSMTVGLGAADSTISILAKSDFVKMKNLTNRFDRHEVRILAKMMVLRAVLKKPDPDADLAKKVEIAIEK